LNGLGIHALDNFITHLVEIISKIRCNLMGLVESNVAHRWITNPLEFTPSSIEMIVKIDPGLLCCWKNKPINKTFSKSHGEQFRQE